MCVCGVCVCVCVCVGGGGGVLLLSGSLRYSVKSWFLYGTQAVVVPRVLSERAWTQACYLDREKVLLFDLNAHILFCIFFQATGLILAFLGFICAIVSVPFDHFKFAHGGLGLVIMIIGLGQPLNAFL